MVIGTESIVNPLQKSALNKKGLCDYVINVASGCLHGCTFCYVPSTPAIRTRQSHLIRNGVNDPQLDWGKYLLVREDIPEKLEQKLEGMRSWHQTASGGGVVLLCSGTDPYQNRKVAGITRRVVEILIRHNRRVRILTRSPLWVNDLDILVHPNVTVGMSLPYLDDELSRRIEPGAPLPRDRYAALLEGYKRGCRLYVAMAPTPPMMGVKEFKNHLQQLRRINPEVIFWEPINARGTNGERMKRAGLDFVDSIMEKKAWADYFVRQWAEVEVAAAAVGVCDRVYVWADSALKGFVDQGVLESWWYRSTVEVWGQGDQNQNLTRVGRSRQLSLFELPETSGQIESRLRRAERGSC